MNQSAPRSTSAEVYAFMKTLVLFITVFLFLRASVVEAFRIPSGSMIPTLRIGDYILVSKLSYGLRMFFWEGFVRQWSEPLRGDIIVFTRPDDPTTPEDESETNLIKRVIGLPGDTIEVRQTRLYINNKLMSEPYARYEEGGTREGNFGPQKVPEGRVLVLGDNRDHSKDSRFWFDPFLPIERIKGRALIVYWSWESWKRIFTIIR